MPPLQPIFVGDVQGCADELEDVLERARERFGAGFELWVVGDVVNRGPASLRALRRVRELVESGRGQLVLGNHEIRLLRTAVGLRSLSPFDRMREVLEAPDADDWIAWLRRRPLAVCGRLGARRFAMVHAAVHPDWDLAALECAVRGAEERLGAGSRRDAEAFLGGDPARDAALDTLFRVTGCRSVDASGGWSALPPEEAPAGQRAWHAEWSARGHDYGVVYGHWSLQGLHVAEGLRGLDTGCVHHGRGRRGFLTAWVPDPEGEHPFSASDEAFWQVPARRAYYAQRDSREKTS